MTADTTTLPPLPPSIEAAHEMGATGGPVVEGERLAFEAWMRGHCWHLSAEWTGSGYRGSSEDAGNVCPRAMMTRRLWAAWRDRAALAQSALAQSAQAPEALAAAEAIAQLRHLVDDLTVEVPDPEHPGLTRHEVATGKQIMFSNMVSAVARLLESAQAPAQPIADPNIRRLTGLWRFGTEALPTTAVDFYGWLNQLDWRIDALTSPPLWLGDRQMKGDKAPAQPAPSVEEVMRLAFQYAQYLAGEMHQAEDKAKAALRSAVEALARGAK